MLGLLDWWFYSWCELRLWFEEKVGGWLVVVVKVKDSGRLRLVCRCWVKSSWMTLSGK